jgi:hypothetical protein
MQVGDGRMAPLSIRLLLNAKNVFSFLGSFVPSFDMVALKAA